jgi:hypothetical protein
MAGKTKKDCQFVVALDHTGRYVLVKCPQSLVCLIAGSGAVDIWGMAAKL